VLLGRTHIRLTLAVLVFLVTLGAFATALRHNHTVEHDGALRRAEDQATITAALAATIFGTNVDATARELSRTYGAPIVSAASLRNTVRTNRAEYGAVLAANGQVLARTPTAPESLVGPVFWPDYLRRVLNGPDRYRVSSLVNGDTVHYATRFSTPAGPRVLVEGIRASSVATLLRAYLGRLPGASRQRGYVVDGHDRIVASLLSARRPGETPDARGPDRTVVSAPIRGTEWRVLLSQRNRDLFRGISTGLEWLVLAALALAGLVAIIMLVRATRRGQALQVAYREQQHEALHDSLTGLANRTLFHNRVEHAAARIARRNTIAAVLFLDLDHFKVVNDSLGHLHGDQMLVEVADRLQSAVRPEDTVARLGGDEFTILLEDLVDWTEAEHIADRVIAGLQAPVGDQGLYLSASIGIALVSAHASAEEIIRDADAAMYRAKSEGRGRHALFDASLREAVVERLAIQIRLRRGLEADTVGPDGLQVFYQPIVAVSDGRLHGFEALARWIDEDGSMMPDAFIPVAEETGLIGKLGRLVLREACRQLSAWHALPGGEDIVMSVNIAARQLLEPGFDDEVEAALADHGLPPSALRLEITETAADADAEAVRAALVALFERSGVRAHLDDFGVGTASLTVLRRFPGDALKIDRSFVASMAADAGALQIVTSVIRLAHALGMTVVAEGVEHTEQLDRLRGLECDFSQGYLVARPMPATDAEALITGDAIPTA
jgi:diguanylate cyclase (GGDEF)-like protein